LLRRGRKQEGLQQRAHAPVLRMADEELLAGLHVGRAREAARLEPRREVFGHRSVGFAETRTLRLEVFRRRTSRLRRGRGGGSVLWRVARWLPRWGEAGGVRGKWPGVAWFDGNVAMASAATTTSSAVGRRIDRTGEGCGSGASSTGGRGRGGRAESGFHRANTMPQRAQDGSTTFVCPQRGQSIRLRLAAGCGTLIVAGRPLPPFGEARRAALRQRGTDGQRGDARMTNRVAEATAPCRIDLAGGTLDIWPIYLFHPGAVTVNVAVDRRAYCRVETGVTGVEIESRDTLQKARGKNVSEVLGGGELSLVAHILRALEIDSGVKVTTQ